MLTITSVAESIERIAKFYTFFKKQSEIVEAEKNEQDKIQIKERAICSLNNTPKTWRISLLNDINDTTNSLEFNKFKFEEFAFEIFNFYRACHAEKINIYQCYLDNFDKLVLSRHLKKNLDKWFYCKFYNTIWCPACKFRMPDARDDSIRIFRSAAQILYNVFESSISEIIKFDDQFLKDYITKFSQDMSNIYMPDTHWWWNKQDNNSDLDSTFIDKPYPITIKPDNEYCCGYCNLECYGPDD